jgi:hypothetical protein
MSRFNVTYEIVTPESAENGDCADQGFELRDCTLREAASCSVFRRLSVNRLVKAAGLPPLTDAEIRMVR